MYDGSAAFGELSLMYSAPRAATIKANGNCRLFTLDLRR
jgi:CRP-like cAMP-binding protein